VDTAPAPAAPTDRPKWSPRPRSDAGNTLPAALPPEEERSVARTPDPAGEIFTAPEPAPAKADSAQDEPGAAPARKKWTPKK
jgi:hypothetical protein